MITSCIKGSFLFFSIFVETQFILLTNTLFKVILYDML